MLSSRLFGLINYDGRHLDTEKDGKTNLFAMNLECRQKTEDV